MTQDLTFEPQRIRSLSGEEHAFTGALLGLGSARLDTHIHPVSAPPPDGVRCSGCRWTEVRIYWDNDALCYIVGLKGCTVVPGEPNRYKCWWTPTPEGAVQALLVTPPRRRAHGVAGEKELPVANRTALEQAADRDLGIERALSAWERLEDEATRRGLPVVPHPAGLTA